jgi:hypothetical protein
MLISWLSTLNLMDSEVSVNLDTTNVVVVHNKSSPISLLTWSIMPVWLPSFYIIDPFNLMGPLNLSLHLAPFYSLVYIFKFNL